MYAYTRWIKRFFALSGAMTVFLILFNFIVDPNGVFGVVSIRGFNKHKTNFTSDRITKFYAARRAKPEAIILGTSRAAFINPADLEKYTGGRAYNLSLFSAGIYEEYANFRYMANNFPIKTLALGIDFISFIEGAPQEAQFSEKRLQSGFYPKDYTDSLFTITAIGAGYKTVVENITEHSADYDDVRGFTAWKKIDYAKDTEAAQKYAGWSKRTMQEFGGFAYPKVKKDKDKIALNLQYLRKLVELAEKKHIRCVVFENPYHGALFDLLYAAGISDIYDDWKRQVAQITDFYDFTGHNAIADNDIWWGDPSHSVSEVGTLMLAEIFNDTSVAVPSGFGVLVTKKNVEAHIATLRKQARHIDMKAILEGR